MSKMRNTIDSGPDHRPCLAGTATLYVNQNLSQKAMCSRTQLSSQDWERINRPAITVAPVVSPAARHGTQLDLARRLARSHESTHGLFDELRHLYSNAIFLSGFFEHLMNTRRLIFIFDLRATLFNAGRHAAEQGFAFALGERITQASICRRQVARRICAGIEVLMEHLIGWREYGTVFPVDATKIRFTVVP
jgi:hypothetical protein